MLSWERLRREWKQLRWDWVEGCHSQDSKQHNVEISDNFFPTFFGWIHPKASDCRSQFPWASNQVLHHFTTIDHWKIFWVSFLRPTISQEVESKYLFIFSLSGSIIFSRSITGVHSTIFQVIFNETIESALVQKRLCSKGGVCRLGQSAEWRGERQGSHGTPGAAMEPRFCGGWVKWNGLLWHCNGTQDAIGTVFGSSRLMWELYWSHLVTWSPPRGGTSQIPTHSTDTTPWHWPVVAISDSDPKLHSWGGHMCAEAEYGAAFGVRPCGWEWTFGEAQIDDRVTPCDMFEKWTHSHLSRKRCSQSFKSMWGWLEMYLALTFCWYVWNSLKSHDMYTW